MTTNANRRTLKLSKDARIEQTEVGDGVFTGIHCYQWSPRVCDPNCVLEGTNAPVSLEDVGKLWVPHYNSISMCIQELAAPGQAADFADAELVAYLWDWDEYQEAYNGTTPANRNLRLQAAFRASCNRSFLAGWWAGTTGVREVRATNAGEGFSPLRELMPNDQCSAFGHWWVLVYEWILDTSTHKLEAVTDQEWRVEGF